MACHPWGVPHFFTPTPRGAIPISSCAAGRLEDAQSRIPKQTKGLFPLFLPPSHRDLAHVYIIYVLYAALVQLRRVRSRIPLRPASHLPSSVLGDNPCQRNPANLESRPRALGRR